MSATEIQATNRYFLPETTKVISVPAVNALATGPTRTELDAGTDLSNEIAAIAGWMISSENQTAPDLGRRFAQQINGRLTAAESSITFWADKTGNDVRELLALDQETFIVFLDGGDVPASPMDVYKVKVSSVGKVREIEGIGRIEVKFTIQAYSENLSVPTA